jgi:hypothetical protein
MLMETDYFKGRKAVLATMHGKERVIGPVLESELGLKTIVPKRFDTDKFGTFTGQIKRPADQLQTAKMKAEAALQLTGCDIAISSEGAFGADPATLGLTQRGIEIVYFIDAKHSIEAIGRHIDRKTNFDKIETRSRDELLAFADKAGFPEHGMILSYRPYGFLPRRFVKGIVERNLLLQRFDVALRSSSRPILAETDMRAMHNPTRMRSIEAAARKLSSILKTNCPSCGRPAFDVTGIAPGLPCELCFLPTELARSTTRSCGGCGYSEISMNPEGKEYAEAQWCPNCNP